LGLVGFFEISSDLDSIFLACASLSSWEGLFKTGASCAAKAFFSKSFGP